MFSITVKWPDGRVIKDSVETHEQAKAIADFLWAAGADDVIIHCQCGDCEECTDRASFMA